MSIVGSILLAATLTSADSAGIAHTRVSLASAPRTTLSAAVDAAARRESLSLGQLRGPVASSPRRMAGRGRPRHSNMTRATAIVAGVIMGSVAGLVGGAVVNATTGNGEVLSGMRVGMPVGAVLGGVVTARLVR